MPRKYVYKTVVCEACAIRQPISAFTKTRQRDGKGYDYSPMCKTCQDEVQRLLDAGLPAVPELSGDDDDKHAAAFNQTFALSVWKVEGLLKLPCDPDHPKYGEYFARILEVQARLALDVIGKRIRTDETALRRKTGDRLGQILEKLEKEEKALLAPSSTIIDVTPRKLDT